MPIPWLGILDAVLGLTALAGSRRARRTGLPDAPARGLRSFRRPDGRLAGILVAALREAFARDGRRLELEREQRDLERLRAERALRLALVREAGEREIARLRLVVGAAIASMVGTFIVSVRLGGGSIGARVAFGCGWTLLLGAIAAAFTAQSAIASTLSRADVDDVRPDNVVAGILGALAPWLVVVGLAVTGLAALVG